MLRRLAEGPPSSKICLAFLPFLIARLFMGPKTTYKTPPPLIRGPVLPWRRSPSPHFASPFHWTKTTATTQHTPPPGSVFCRLSVFTSNSRCTHRFHLPLPFLGLKTTSTSSPPPTHSPILLYFCFSLLITGITSHSFLLSTAVDTGQQTVYIFSYNLCNLTLELDLLNMTLLCLVFLRLS